MMIVYRIIIPFEIIILRAILVRKATRLAVIFNLILDSLLLNFY